MVKTANLSPYIIIALILIAGSSFGQAPSTMSYQGRLTDISGEPITSAQTVAFSVYESPTEESAIWAETLFVAPDVQGIFTVELGNENPLSGDVFDGDVLYLGITVGNDEEMTPRQRLTSTPYAISAENIRDYSVSTVKLADTAVTTPKLADDAVTSSKVLDNSLDATDLRNESGLTFKMSLPPNTFRTIPVGTSPLDSVKITVPAAGFVYVNAHADISIDHINGIQDQLLFQVSPQADTIIPNNYGSAMIVVPPDLPTQASNTRYVYPVEAHRPFEVTGSGEVTYYFNAKILSGAGNDDTFFNLQMTAMYFPTAYGSVSLSPPAPDSVNAEETLSEDERLQNSEE